MHKDKALCPDAKIRVVYYGEPDTFFSIPAYVTVKRGGRRVTVRGYITSINPDSIPPSLRTEKGYEFRPYLRYLGIIPNSLSSIEAVYRKATTGEPPKWRWIWDSLQYDNKWGTAW